MFQIATNFFTRARTQTQERSLMVLSGHTETFNTPEKASHNMLETHVNSHNITITGHYQLDVELMLNARTMITLH